MNIRVYWLISVISIFLCCRTVSVKSKNVKGVITVLFEGGFDGEVIAVVDGDTILRKHLTTIEAIGTTGERLFVPDQAHKLTLHYVDSWHVVELEKIKLPVLRVEWSYNGWWILESEKIPVYE